MTIRDIEQIIERFAPLALQEPYDNSGLVVGHPDREIKGVLVAVDVTDRVLDEALDQGCDLIVTHHPLIFHPLKRLNGQGYVERLVERAVREGIALYACHTNLDSVRGGTSWRLAEQLGVGGLRILEPAADDGSSGFGVVGTLAEPMDAERFVAEMKRLLGLSVVRHSAFCQPVSRVAVCTGAGGSLIGRAADAGADLYVTADLKYNDFMTPDGRLTVADIGHFESEYCAIGILFDVLTKNLLNFAVRKSRNSRNPVQYMV